MKEVAISEFRAKCLAMIEQVRKTKRPIRITRYGKPLADIIPPSPPLKRRDWLGCMAGTAEIRGDILSPVVDMNEFEAWRNDSDEARRCTLAREANERFLSSGIHIADVFGRLEDTPQLKRPDSPRSVKVKRKAR